MCQSKAEGGRRCAAHLEQYATAGIIDYARITSGLSKAQVKDAYEAAIALADPGETDPTRDEVDTYLHATASQVRNDPAIPPQPKATIVTRLMDAVGRAKPSAATFRAWKSVIVDAWTKVRRQAIAGFAAATVVMSVGACGNAPDQPQPDATAAPVAISTQAPAQYDTTYTVAEPTYSQPAVNRYGRDEVAAGTTVAVNVVKDIGFDENLVSTPLSDLSPNDFYASNATMTDDCRAAWTSNVQRYLRSDGQDSMNNVWAMSIADVVGTLNDDAIRLPKEGPVATDPRITKVDTTLASNGATLIVAVTAKSTMRIDRDDEPHVVTVTKESNIFLIRDSEGWKIDGWSGQVAGSRITPALD